MTPDHPAQDGSPPPAAKPTLPGKYVYSFCVWPDETWKHPCAIFTYFKMANTRVDMTFTQEEFERFRSEMSHAGLTLREVERWPHCEPETIL